MVPCQDNTIWKLNHMEIKPHGKGTIYKFDIIHRTG